MARQPATPDDDAVPDDAASSPEVAPESDAAKDWRMDVPEGWLLWEPGTADADELAASVTTTPRATRSLRRRILIVEREVELVAGDVRQVGLRAAQPTTGAISASMRMTHWLRPVTDGKVLNARRHLDELEADGPDPGRVFQHREHSIVKVPAGRLVLRNEISRIRRRVGTSVQLVTTIFPTGTSSMFEITMTSKYMELQPYLMAEISLMAHSFRA